MPRKNKIIIFEELTVLLPPVKWKITKSNPAYWQNDGVRGSFQYVYAPSYPEIEAAYRKAKIRVFRPESLDQEEELVERIEQPDNNKDLFDLEAGLLDDVRPQKVVEEIETELEVVSHEEVRQEIKEEKQVEVSEEELRPDLPEQPNATMKWRDLSWPKMRGLLLTIKPELPRSLTKADVVAGLEQCEREGLL